MDTSRRSFLKTGAWALAGATLMPRDLFAFKKKGLTGLQLYSIREDMAKDPLGSLRQLAEMGYQYVEHAGYRDGKFYGYAPSEFRKILVDLGMRMPSGHSVLGRQHWDATAGDFSDEWKKTLDDAAIAGQEFVISPWLDESLRTDADKLKGFMEVFNRCGELCKSAGVRFGYHNHAFEFSEKLDGTTIFDLIMQQTEADLVAQQLDIGNMYNAGARAMDILGKYPGRFESLHVKDEVKSEGREEPYESTILGTGLIGVKEVIDAAKKLGGTRHFIIEQESYQGKAPIDCMRDNLVQMKAWGY